MQAEQKSKLALWLRRVSIPGHRQRDPLLFLKLVLRRMLESRNLCLRHRTMMVLRL